MPIKANDVLTKEYLDKLNIAKDYENGDTQAAKWANLGWIAIKTELNLSTKGDAVAILMVINTQLIQTEKATYLKQPGLWSQRECPNKTLLISMLNANRPRILAFTDPKEYNLAKLKDEYGEGDLAAKCDVINWCRELVNGENGTIKIEGNVTFGGEYHPGDYNGPASTTTNAGPTRPTRPTSPNVVPPTPSQPPKPPSGAKTTFNFPGGLIGRVDASGEYIKIRGKDYDPTSEEHRGFAEKYGYDLVTGKKK